MFADLHIHTQFSDGSNSPEQVAQLASQKGIELIAVCDHNSIKSYPRLQSACQEHSIRCIRGAEVDSSFNNYKLHILAYGCDPDNIEFTTLLDNNANIMEQMSVDLIEKMSSDFPNVSISEYEQFNRDVTHGGWKGIDYLKDKGFDDFPECMRYYREYNVRPAPFTSVISVCDIIHRAGGMAVLAHPADCISHDKSVLVPALNELLPCGIDGLECYYPSHNEEMTNLCIAFGKEHDLLITIGNDCHGIFASYIDGVTYGLGKIKIDIENLNLKGLV